MVLVSQGVGHHTDHLLPGSLAGRGEVLAVVGSQDDDEDVTQELPVQGAEAISWGCPHIPPHRPTRVSGELTAEQGADLSLSDLSQIDPGPMQGTRLVAQPVVWHALRSLGVLDPLPAPSFACCVLSSLGFY